MGGPARGEGASNVTWGAAGKMNKQVSEEEDGNDVVFRKFSQINGVRAFVILNDSGAFGLSKLLCIIFFFFLKFLKNSV